MQSEPTVYVVDDDEPSRRSVCALARSMGVAAESFTSAESFLERYAAASPGCLVTDIRMMGMSGLELQEELNRRNMLLPVVVLTAFARTPLTVRAIQAGAITLLEKPYHEDELWDAIRTALAQDSAQRSRHEHRQDVRERIAQLTPAERSVLDRVVQGQPNKAIAQDMDISLRTVENRRKELYAKLGVSSVVELVRMVIEAGGET